MRGFRQPRATKRDEREAARQAVAAASQDLAAARAREVDALSDESADDEDDDGREDTVLDTAAAVERVYEDGLAASSEWERFRKRVEQDARESERAAFDRLSQLDRRISRARETAKHAPTHAKRLSIERKIERLDEAHGSLFASLHEPITDAELGAVFEPVRCAACGSSLPDRGTRWEHNLHGCPPQPTR